MEYVYKRTRPRLTVESTGGKKLGSCYGISFYVVTSTYPLTEDRYREPYNRLVEDIRSLVDLRYGGSAGAGKTQDEMLLWLRRAIEKLKQYEAEEVSRRKRPAECEDIECMYDYPHNKH